MNRNLRDFIKTAREMGPEHYVELKKPVEGEFEVKIESDEHLWNTMRLEDYLKKG